MRFLYFYLMTDAPDQIGKAGPRHAAYWVERGLPKYLGGPFADRSGGLITFEAASMDEARAVVDDDPFVRESLLTDGWLKEWLPS
jgi:hypothetical protein